MSYFTYEDPTERSGDRLTEKVVTHPCFAQIGASRVSGNKHLHGSDFSHQHYVTITICRSEVHRSLSTDWNHGRDELIEVALSEAQWATFVSAMNIGDGVPCTLQHVNRQRVPQLTPPEKQSKKFSDDMARTMTDIQQSLKNLTPQLGDAVNKTKAKAIQRELELIASRLTGNTGFVADQFVEHMEGTIEKAKIEVNAYATAIIQKAGLEAISNGAPLSLEYKTTEQPKEPT